MIKSRTLQVLYQVICASFCVIVVVSNILSAKMVALPFFALSIPAGLIAYPLTFLLSDLVTEIFGARRAKLMVYIALAMNLLIFGMIQVALLLPDNGFDGTESISGSFRIKWPSDFFFSHLLCHIPACGYSALCCNQAMDWPKIFVAPQQWFDLCFTNCGYSHDRSDLFVVGTWDDDGRGCSHHVVLLCIQSFFQRCLHSFFLLSSYF